MDSELVEMLASMSSALVRIAEAMKAVAHSVDASDAFASDFCDELESIRIAVEEKG